MKIDAINSQIYLNHLNVIQKLTGLDNNHEAGQVYEKLRRIEVIASSDATKWCNGDIEVKEYEKREGRTKKAVEKAIGKPIDGLFVNGDPRGYALKIKEGQAKELGIYTDWGDYGILAPEF